MKYITLFISLFVLIMMIEIQVFGEDLFPKDQEQDIKC